MFEVADVNKDGVLDIGEFGRMVLSIPFNLIDTLYLVLYLDNSTAS